MTDVLTGFASHLIFETYCLNTGKYETVECGLFNDAPYGVIIKRPDCDILAVDTHQGVYFITRYFDFDVGRYIYNPVCKKDVELINRYFVEKRM